MLKDIQNKFLIIIKKITR